MITDKWRDFIEFWRNRFGILEQSHQPDGYGWTINRKIFSKYYLLTKLYSLERAKEN